MKKPYFAALSYDNSKGLRRTGVSWCLKKSDLEKEGSAEDNNFHLDNDLPKDFKRVHPDDYRAAASTGGTCARMAIAPVAGKLPMRHS